MTSALAQTENAVHAVAIVEAAVALGLSGNFASKRSAAATIPRVAFATGLPAATVARVVGSPEYIEEHNLLLERIRDNPLMETVHRKLSLLALRGLKEINDLLDDSKISRVKKVDTAFKLLAMCGYATAHDVAPSLINAETVNILQVAGGPTPEEAAALRAMRDRALRGNAAVVVEAVASA